MFYKFSTEDIEKQKEIVSELQSSFDKLSSQITNTSLSSDLNNQFVIETNKLQAQPNVYFVLSDFGQIKAIIWNQFL